MDIGHAVMKWIDHNRAAVAGFIVTIILSVVLVSCQVTTPSIFNPRETVTATELKLEIAQVDSMAAQEKATYDAKFAMLYKKADVAVADIQAKVEFYNSAFDMASGMVLAAAQGASPSPAAIVGSLAQLVLGGLALGMTVDRVRGSKRIQELKAQVAETAPKAA